MAPLCCAHAHALRPAGLSLSNATTEDVSGALDSLSDGLAASLNVSPDQLTVGAPTADANSTAVRRRRGLLQQQAPLVFVPFAVALDPRSGAIGARAAALSASIAAAAASAASPLYTSLQQVGLTATKAAVARPPKVSVGCGVLLPVAGTVSSRDAIASLNATLQPGGAVESGITSAVGNVFTFFPGTAPALVLPPPARPRPPPPSPRPPFPPLPPAAPADQSLGCDSQPCFPGAVWCAFYLRLPLACVLTSLQSRRYLSVYVVAHHTSWTPWVSHISAPRSTNPTNVQARLLGVSFLCGACPPGFFGAAAAIGPAGCSDVDECVSGPCDALTQCINTVGSFSCSAHRRSTPARPTFFRSGV